MQDLLKAEGNNDHQEEQDELSDKKSVYTIDTAKINMFIARSCAREGDGGERDVKGEGSGIIDMFYKPFKQRYDPLQETGVHRAGEKFKVDGAKFVPHRVESWQQGV